MEERARKLLATHDGDRDLTQEEDIAGLDWTKADLSGFNLANCELSIPGKTATFTEANLSESNLFRAKLENATLDDANLSKSDLRGASLEGAYLQGADLSKAQMESCQMSGAYLAKANLEGADLSHVVYIGGNLIGANLKGANLSGASLEAIDGSRADCTGATFRSGHFSQCQFQKTTLNEADLADSMVTGCEFAQSHMNHANLARAVLEDCQFKECHLNDANLVKAKAKNCNFDRAHLKGGILVDGDLTGSSFDDTHLQGSFLNSANFTDCSLEGADLRNSKVRDADFTRARIYQTVLLGANMEFAKLGEVWTYEEEQNYPKSMDLYRNLKNIFRENGAHARASRYSYQESVMQRKQFHKEERWGMWVGYMFADAVCGYGEHIQKTIAFALSIIVIFSMVYHFGDGVMHPNDKGDLTLREHFYFSTTTFTTLGYGDYAPKEGNYQIVAVSEALIGVILMAFIVVTLTRKIVT